MPGRPAQGLLQLLPAWHLVAEEFMNVTIIFFQIQIVVLVLNHGLKEIEAVAIGQQTFQSQNRLFNHFLARELSDISFTLIRLKVT